MRYNISEQLSDLKLKGMRTAYLSQSEQPLVRNLSFDERLSLLLEAETIMRTENKSKRLLNNARLLEPGALLEDIDFSPERRLDKQEIATLSTLQWQDKGENLLIIGATGTGKTYMASAFGYAFCMKGVSVRCHGMSALLKDLAAGHSDGTYTRKMDALLKPDVLILDDFGLRNLDVALSMDLFDVASERVRNKKVFIIASQLPVRKWPEVFENRTAGDGFMDRVVRNANRIMLFGSSRRPSVPYRPEWAAYDPDQPDGQAYIPATASEKEK